MWAHFRQGGVHKLQEGLRSLGPRSLEAWNPQGQNHGQGQGQGQGGDAHPSVSQPHQLGVIVVPQALRVIFRLLRASTSALRTDVLENLVHLLQHAPENMDIFLKVPPRHCTEL